MIRIGHGFDVHRLVPKRKLYLAGLRIKSKLGTLGHSDGDPVLHSVTDAILGACKMGDIGQMFSDRSKKIYDRLILTCPFAQLSKLSKKYIKAPFIKNKVRMDANITVMFLIKKTNKNVSSYLFDDNVLGWAAKENSKKRFKSHQDLWTLQSTHKWANKKINKNRENKNVNSKTLIDRFFKLTGIKKTRVLFSLNHGWKYSSNSNPLNLKSYWNSSLNLGVCADWFVGPRLEAGWISANDLYKKIIK